MDCGNTHLKTHKGSRGKRPRKIEHGKGNKETSLNNHVLWLHDGLMLVERLQIDSKQQQATKKRKKEKKRNASHNIWITTEETKHPIISKYLVMSVIKKNSPIGKSKSKKNQQPGLPSSSPCRPLLFSSFSSSFSFSLASPASLSVFVSHLAATTSLISGWSDE